MQEDLFEKYSPCGGQALKES